ncbi:hypothetical protein PoMZ_00225, partial [Pyricularia oryzae]
HLVEIVAVIFIPYFPSGRASSLYGGVPTANPCSCTFAWSVGLLLSVPKSPSTALSCRLSYATYIVAKIMGLALGGLIEPQLPYDFLVGQQFSVLRESDRDFGSTM